MAKGAHKPQGLDCGPQMHQHVQCPTRRVKALKGTQSTFINQGKPLTQSHPTTHVMPSLLALDHHHTTTVLRPFFQDHSGELVPEQNFWTLWCKGRLTEAHTDHLAGCHSIQINQCPPPPSPPHFFTGRMPFLPPNQQCQSTEGLAHSN